MSLRIQVRGSRALVPLCIAFLGLLGFGLQLEVLADSNVDKPKAGKNAADEIVAFEKCKSIRMFLHTFAWSIEFLPDGSGSIQYGSSFGDGGSFPPGTVDFKTLYETTRKTSFASDKLPEKYSTDEARQSLLCGVIFEPSESRNALYSTNRKILKQAFDKGYNATGRNRHRLDYLRLYLDPFGVDPFSLAASDKEPSIKGAKSIGLFTRFGWQLHIHADGSGELSVMDDESMRATFPAKSFKRKQVFAELFAKPAKDQADRFAKQYVIFATRKGKGEYQHEGIVPNLDAVERIVEQAWTASAKPAKSLDGLDQQRLDVIYAKYPFVRPSKKNED